jgi:flavin reductase (DIM6/NTAB) family NADH-FMN oxidoreductase RutF
MSGAKGRPERLTRPPGGAASEASIGGRFSGGKGRPAATPSAFSERQFRDALAQFATGVTVVCARAPDHRYVGFTANSFSSVSLDPPLILWTLSTRSASLAAFESAGRYAVNVLAADQVDLARRFSRPHEDRFAHVPFRLGWSDAPLIEGCVAWFECRHHARFAAGDHMIFIGEVVTVERAPGDGLVFVHGRFESG